MLGVWMFGKKFKASAGALAVAVALTGLVGQVPSVASTARPQAPQANASCDGDSVPPGFPYKYQAYSYPNECYACQLDKWKLGVSIPTFCQLIAIENIAVLWYGNHLG
jgi:hypothetical protein